MIKKLMLNLLSVTALAAATTNAFSQEKPEELKVGISTYLSGSASVFGVPAKAAADILIENINAAGGIDGVKIVPTYIYEGGGGEKLLSEYRRLAEGGTKVMLSAISSGHCNIVAPVAEDLKVLNILWDCGTEKVLEEKDYQYVVRTQANATAEMVAAVLYLLKEKPDFKTLAIINQDYAWGRDSRDIFLATLKKLKPDVKVVAEMFPKFGAPDFSTEISRLQALRPDVVLSTSWGGDLDNFVRQASQRNLFKNSTFVLPLAESSLERLGSALPEGVIVGARGDHFFLHPETKNDADHLEFIKKFREKTGAYPIYSVYHMVQAIQGLKAGYEKAIKDNDGKWPTPEMVAKAMHNVEFKGFGRPIAINREDGQSYEAQLMGTTKKLPEFPFMVMDKMVIYPGEGLVAPVGQKSLDWINTIDSSILNNDNYKSYNH